MTHDFGDGVKLIVPDGKDATMLVSYHIDGTDDLKGVQRGSLIELMAMSVNQMEELLKCMPRKVRKHYIVAIAETIAEFATEIDGLDVVMVKKNLKEDADEEDI